MQPLHSAFKILQIIAGAYAKGKGIVVYKLPGNKSFIIESGDTNPVFSFNEITNTAKNAFCIFPFQTNKDTAAGYFISKKKSYIYDLELLKPEPSKNNIFYFKDNEKENLTISPEAEYNKLVEKALQEIGRKNLEKVVVSRANKIQLPGNFEALAFFSKLAMAYENAFVYLVSTPQTGTWIGATPELLLQQNGNQIKTMSLAGTIPNTENEQDIAINFTEKERNEQKLVTDYIKEILNKYTENIEVNGPEIKKAGRVSHLITNFKASLKEAKSGCFAEIINELHPTPAVCGIPKEKSLQFILENESYKRSFYTGFLGPVTADGKADLFVNLRCMQLFESSAVLYAGGGILEGSDPQKEWQETEHKMETLLQFIFPENK